MDTHAEEPKINTYWLFAILAAFIGIMSTVLIFKVPVPLALFCTWFTVFLFGKLIGFSYESLQDGLIKGILSGMIGVLIIITVGAIIGSWIAGGIVPSVIYYGLNAINPTLFLPIAFFVCAITSLVTGTSFGSVGTVGIAMMGIGHGFDLPLPIVAGAVISGAYVGDAISPLSDTTVLAASLCEVTLIDHVKSMAWVGIPAGIVAFTAFALTGSGYATDSQSMAITDSLIAQLGESFVISPLLLLPLVVTIILLAMKKPAMPVIFIGACLGVLCAWLVQGNTFIEAFKTLYLGNVGTYAGENLDRILNRGGISSMLPVVVIVIFALGLGGLMERLGVLDAVARKLSKLAKGAGSLSVITILCGFFGSVFGGAAYVSLFTASSMTKKIYDTFSINRTVLSRNSEAGGTLSCPMIPWTSGAMFMSTTTGVGTLSYLPFMWYHFLFIAFSILAGITGYAIWKQPKIAQ